MGITTNTRQTITIDSTDLEGLGATIEPTGIIIRLPAPLGSQVINFPLDVLDVFGDLIAAVAANEDVQALVTAAAVPETDEEPQP